MTSGDATILVIEDDRALREGLVLNFELHGYRVYAAANGEEGMRKAFDLSPDLIVLDVMLPGWSGLDILAELRDHNQNVPVLILSARGSTDQKIEGLNIGADDYLAKPFELRELLARVEAMLRRSGVEGQGVRPALLSGFDPGAPENSRGDSQQCVGLGFRGIAPDGRQLHPIAAPKARTGSGQTTLHPHRPWRGLQASAVSGYSVSRHRQRQESAIRSSERRRRSATGTGSATAPTHPRSNRRSRR